MTRGRKPKSTQTDSIEGQVVNRDAYVAKQAEDAIVETVAKIKKKTKAKVGKPTFTPHTMTTSGHMRTAAYMPANVMAGTAQNFYSPELSTDFLELPQSRTEQYAFYRFFYDHEPYVAQAIDLHSELAIPKVRLKRPKAKNAKIADLAMSFCESWVNRVDLQSALLSIIHDFYLIGEVNIWAEDENPEVPEELLYDYEIISNPETGEVTTNLKRKPNADDLEVRWLFKNYKGWSSIQVLPPEQVERESFSFTKESKFKIKPDSKVRDVIQKAFGGDEESMRIVATMPESIVEAIIDRKDIVLNTDPDAGSFLYYMARKKSSYDQKGKSILQRCLRTLVYRDKLRQSQTSISSRHMTPFRIIWGDKISTPQMIELQQQVDLAIQDPDYSIIANYEVHWEERGGGSENRLLELSGEYETTDRQLYAGLGVTESLLTGESTYSGDRIHLEVLNTRYTLMRMVVQRYVDEYLLKPMCARLGFVEENEFGDLEVIYPKLSFTRLSLRDNQEVFDSLFNLYQKGSLDVDTIYDILGLDADTINQKLKEDVFTIKDPVYNELVRSVYTYAGQKLPDQSNILEKLIRELNLTYKEAPAPPGGMGRFAKTKNKKEPETNADIVSIVTKVVLELKNQGII
jgi:hypothetical protein